MNNVWFWTEQYSPDYATRMVYMNCIVCVTEAFRAADTLRLVLI